MDKEIISVLERIRQIRNKKGISIVDLATKAGIARSYIYYIESKKKIPTLQILNKIAKALDVEMIEFFEIT